MYKKRAQVYVATFGDAEQPLFVSARVLPWNQSQPSGQLPPILKSSGVPDSSNYGRRNDRTDAFNG